MYLKILETVITSSFGLGLLLVLKNDDLNAEKKKKNNV